MDVEEEDDDDLEFSQSSSSDSSDSSELARPSDDAASTTSIRTTDPAAPPPATRTFFHTRLDGAAAAAGALPQLLTQRATEQHFQLCQMLRLDAADPVSARGDRVYYVENRTVLALDVPGRLVSPLIECSFRPLGLEVHRMRVALCGNGDQLLVVHAYTGHVLFSREQRGSHLTNCIRLFVPPLGGATALSSSSAAAASAAAKAAEVAVPSDDRAVVAQQSAARAERLLQRLLGDWNAAPPDVWHALVGGNNDGVVVFSVGSVERGAVVATLPFPTFINEIAIAPDSSQFVALGDTDDIFFVDIVCAQGAVSYARRCKREFEPPSPTHHPQPGGFSAAWSSDSRRVAVLRETPGVVNIVDVATLDVLAVLPPESRERSHVPLTLRVVAYDEQFVAFTEVRGNVWIYDARTFAARQYIDMEQLHTRVWHSCPPTLDAVVFARELAAPDVLAAAQRYLRRHRDSSGATGAFSAAAVRHARYIAARHSSQLKFARFDSKCTGMVLAPGRLICARPNIVVLHANAVPSLATCAAALVVTQRRAEHENDRRTVLHDWCVRAVRRLVRMHNAVVDRARRLRVAANMQRLEREQRLSASSPAAASAARSLQLCAPGHLPTERLSAQRFAEASSSLALANKSLAALAATPRRAHTTDDIAPTRRAAAAAAAASAAAPARVVNLANPLIKASASAGALNGVPLLDFDLGDLLTHRELHRVVISRFSVAFWQLTTDVQLSQVGSIVKSCVRVLADCLVQEQRDERFKPAAPVPPPPAAPDFVPTAGGGGGSAASSASSSAASSAATSSTSSSASWAPAQWVGPSWSLLASHLTSARAAAAPAEPAASTPPEAPKAAAPAPPAAPHDLLRVPPAPLPPKRRSNSALLRADDLPARLVVADVLAELPPLQLLPHASLDQSALPRRLCDELQADARAVYCIAPTVRAERAGQQRGPLLPRT